jgi:uncharacterized protein YidB (DUF937 family)
VNKLMYKPITLGASVLGGLLAGAIFKKVWQLAAGEDEAPRPTDAERGWTEVLVAAALRGAVSAMVRATVDRGTAAGTRRLTGTWPGDDEEQPIRAKQPSAA